MKSPRADAAATVLRFAHVALGPTADVGIRCWDGSRAGDPEAPLQLVLLNRRALRRLIWSPDELGFARAYVSGDLEIEGDIYAGLAELNRINDPDRRHQPPGRPRRSARAAPRRHRPRRPRPSTPPTPGRGPTSAA